MSRSRKASLLSSAAVMPAVSLTTPVLPSMVAFSTDRLGLGDDRVAGALLLLAVEVAVDDRADGGVAAGDAADVAGGVLGHQLHIGIVVAGHAGLHAGDAADGGGVDAGLGIDAAAGIVVGDDGKAVLTDDAAGKRRTAGR